MEVVVLHSRAWTGGPGVGSGEQTYCRPGGKAQGDAIHL